ALPAAQFGASEGYEAPQGEIEEALAAIWAEVLGLERVGRHDPFFDIGGHSLLLVRVHRMLQDRCQVSLPLVQLFQYPTVAALARRIQQGATAAPSEAAKADHRALRQRAALIQRRQSAAGVN
ncbi:Acyl carrier protein, partial [Paracidovorax valerianellae]